MEQVLEIITDIENLDEEYKIIFSSENNNKELIIRQFVIDCSKVAHRIGETDWTDIPNNIYQVIDDNVLKGLKRNPPTFAPKNSNIKHLSGCMQTARNIYLHLVKVKNELKKLVLLTDKQKKELLSVFGVFQEQIRMTYRDQWLEGCNQRRREEHFESLASNQFGAMNIVAYKVGKNGGNTDLILHLESGKCLTEWKKVDDKYAANIHALKRCIKDAIKQAYIYLKEKLVGFDLSEVIGIILISKNRLEPNIIIELDNYIKDNYIKRHFELINVVCDPKPPSK
ncbi:MAG: hypothetical protein RLN62_02580 [Rickettsiales bacterium]